MAHPNLTKNSPYYTDVLTRCVECDSLIIETILKKALETHLDRIRCCDCLARIYQAEKGTRVAD